VTDQCAHGGCGCDTDAKRERRRAASAAWRKANPEKHRANSAAWYAANPEKAKAWRNSEKVSTIRRARSLQHFYGLTIDQYQRMLAGQGGVCFICRRAPKARRLDVDHCHKTGRIRGLLCHRCNRGIGMFSEPEHLTRAGEYCLQDTGLVVPKRKAKKKVDRARLVVVEDATE
jgi:hypothetical protein